MNISTRRNLLTSALLALAFISATPAFAAVVDYTVTEAIADAWGQHSGGHAFWLKGLFHAGDSAPERTYIFDGTPTFTVDDGGTPEVIDDDTIAFIGALVNVDDEDLTFDFDVSFSRLSRDDAPGGTPKLELKPGAYIDAGPVPGIDPSLWSFWLLNEGTLEGTGALAGGVIELEHRMMGGELAPAFQLGDGASGKNILNGFSGWIDWSTMDQPDDHDYRFRWDGHGDININLNRTRIPVPGTATLLLAGLLGVGLSQRRRNDLSK